MERLLAHELSAGCRFDARRRSFVFEGVRRRGLTRALAAAHPVPVHNRSECSGCAGRRDRRTTAQFAARAAGFRARAGPVFQSRKRQRAGDPDLIVVRGGGGAPATMTGSRCRGNTDMAHGVAVDRDMERACDGELDAEQADPCALALVAYVREVLRWRMVATQVPVYSRRTRLATAIDLLCEDAKGKLHLVEVKTTRRLDAGSRACYLGRRGDIIAAAADALPLSRYAHHQWQLWAMMDVVTNECGVRLAGGCVLRTSPTGVDRFPLNPWFTAQADVLRERLAAVTR